MSFLYDEYIKFLQLTPEQQEKIAMEMLKNASPSDIVDGLYMQKTAHEDLHKKMQKQRREMNKAKSGIKSEFKKMFNDLGSIRDFGDGKKIDKITKLLKKRKLALGLGAIGTGAAIATNTMDEKKASVSSLIDELYKVAKITVPDKAEIKKETKPPKKDELAQDDIECEVCDFKGQPTYDGLCPQCGAIGGHKPSDIYAKTVEQDQRNWGDPYQGISVEEADYIGRMNEGVS